MKTKTQFMNRILSFVLSIMMVVSMLPASTLSVFAADTTYPYAVVDTEAGTVTIDGTLGGKTEATEEEVNALVEQLKAYVDNGITTIVIPGTEHAMYDSALGMIPSYAEALYLLTYLDRDGPYCGTIDLILPDATEIIDFSFDSVVALKSITLPKVTTVGDGAFYGCQYLEKITFGSVITEVVEIESGVFASLGTKSDNEACDLVLNCGQLNAEDKYKPNLESNVWYIGEWSGETEWKSITLTHTEGTAATCIAQAVCSVCGESYGDIDADAHSYGDWVSNGNNTHTRTCANDNTHTDNGDCSGGMATCTEQAVCSLCKTAYGELGGHTLTYTANGNVITVTCSAECGYTGTATISATGKTYDGTALEASVAYSDSWASDNLTIAYAVKDGNALNEAPKNAGTYTASIAIGGATVSVDFTIAKADPTYVVPTGLPATCGQTLVDVTLPTPPPDYTRGHWTWNDSTQSVGAEGENQFDATFTPEDTTNYNTITAKVTVIVSKLPATVTTAPTGISGLEYTGEAQALVTAGVASGGEVQYKLGNGEWTTTIPTATDAGDYIVYWKVVGDSDHGDTAEQYIEVNIRAKDGSNATATFEQESYQYDGTEKKPAVTVVIDGKTLDEGTDYTVKYVDNIYVGLAAVEISFQGNYSGGASANFVIAQDPDTTEFEGEWTAVSNLGAGSGSANAPALSGTELTLSAAANSGYVSPATGEAKIYGASVNLGGDISMKYLVELGADVDIEQVGLRTVFLGEVRVLTVDTDASGNPVTKDGKYVFTLTGINPQCMGDDIDAELYVGETKVDEKLDYSVKDNLVSIYDNCNYATKQLIIDTLEYGAAAQTYRGYKTNALVTAGLSETMTAHLNDEGRNFDNTIPKSTPNVSGTGADSIKEARVVFGTINSIQVSYTNGETKTLTSSSVAAYDFTKKMQFSVDGLFTLGYSVNDYCYDVCKSETTSDNMKALAQTLYNYGLSAHFVKGNHSGENNATCVHGKICEICAHEYGEPNPDKHMSEEFTYTDNADGTHTKKRECCEEIVNEAEAHDHTNGKCVCGVKATPVVTAPTAKTDLIYDGTEQALIDAGSTTGGTLQYSLDNAAWSTEIPTATNAGDYTVYYKVVGGENYEDVAAQSIIVTITDKTTPAGTILIKENGWNKFWNTITFGIFCKDYVDVTITADGTGSGVAKVEYLLSETALDENNIPDDGWTTLTKDGDAYKFRIQPKNKVAVYVRITDEGGNVTVINSDGIVVYEDSEAVTTAVTYTYKENSNKDIAVEFNGNTVRSIACGEINIAPNIDFTVDNKSGKIVLQAFYLDTLNAGNYTFTVSYNPMGVKNSGVDDLTTTFTVKVEPTSIAGATVNVSDTFTYDGNVKTPDPVVVLNGETLVKDQDYTVSYNNNTNATNDGQATVIVTGKGNYTGSANGSFEIERAKLTDVSVQQNGKLAYNGGKALTPAVTANATALNGAKVLFMYSADGTSYGDMPTFTEAGTYTVYYCAYTTDNNFIDQYDTFTVTIDKAIVTEPTIASKPFNNAVQKADISDTDLYTVEKNNGGTAKGSYDVVLKLKDSANYKWSTTDSAEVTVQFVISAAENSWDTKPAISGWTYGETANAPTYKAKFGTVKVVYSGNANDGTDYNSETAPTKAGNYTATFTVEGTEDYSGLSEQVNFTIAKKAITVTANDASKTYGDSDPTFTYTHTDLVGSDALVITVARASGENANTYTITASQAEGANPNYEITFKTGTFTIRKAALTVTVEDKTATYGDTVPTYTVKYDGFVSGDDKDDLGGTLAFDCDYAQFSDKGEYTIKASGYTSGNYTISFVDGKLNVSAKPITVTIQNVTSIYGEALAELKATDNGIVNNDKDVYSLATVATSTSNVGKYAITGNALDSNYAISFVNGEYEITKREITITVEAKNTIVNTALPTYTYKVEGLVGEDKLETEPTLTSNADITVIGEYDITATGADAGGNYSIKYVPAKLTVLTDNAVDAAAGYTEELKGYEPATVTSEDKAELDEILNEINTLLDDESITDNGKKALEEVKEQVEKLIKEITDAADATDTENVGKVENVTPENVTPENKTDLEGAKADLEKALEDHGSNMTEDEKKAVEDEIKRIDDALEVIGNVEAVEELIDKLPDTIKKDDETAIKAADDAYNALSDYEKSLVDADAKKALDDAKAALAELNKPADSTSPDTGDHSNMFLWIALLFISGGAVITLTVVDRKRKAAKR